MNDQKDLWKKRAEFYNKLDWVSKENILQGLMLVGNFNEDDKVLDVGCGTGKVACTVAPFVKEVHGFDISKEMMSKIDLSKYPNLRLKEGSISSIDFSDESFDKVTARLILHHILDDRELDKSIKEIHRVLKPGGRIIISEGVPPHEDVKDDYTEIFKLKEERRTFMPKDLVDLLKRNGFKNIRTNIIIDEHMSVRNWLENAGTLSKEVIEKIYDLHKNASPRFKELYNLKEKEGDILIDVKVAIITGEK